MPAIDSGGGHVLPSSARPVRLRLDIAYDGTEFAGWARPGRAAHRRRGARRGVVDGVPRAGRTCARRAAPTPACTPPVRWHTSTSRPRRSAHAYPRVRRGTVEPEFLPLVRRLAKFLPTDVRVREIVRAPAGFDARFSALRRHYAYRLSTAPYGVEPQQARFVTPGRGRSTWTRWRRRRGSWLGLHDFAAFCRHRDGATTIRELQRLDWVRDGDLRHRVRHRRRVLLEHGAVAGRRAAGGGGGPARPGLVGRPARLEPGGPVISPPRPPAG